MVVADDGTVLATWPLPEEVPTQRSAAPVPVRRAKRPSGVRQSARGPRDHDGLLAMLAAEGYPAVLTPGGHLKVGLPGGPVFLASTPSDTRGVRNAAALLRRYGATLRHNS